MTTETAEPEPSRTPSEERLAGGEEEEERARRGEARRGEARRDETRRHDTTQHNKKKKKKKKTPPPPPLTPAPGTYVRERGSPELDDVERTETLSAGGTTIRVGSVTAVVPLVLCNGIGASLDVLQPLVDHLRPDRPVVRFDVPGTGESPTPVLPYGFPYLAWVLGRILDQLGYSRADVLGFSWGGALAQQFVFRTREGAVAWSWQPPPPARSWSPPARSSWLRSPPRAATAIPTISPRSPPRSTAGRSISAPPPSPRSDPTCARSPRRGYLYQLLAGTVWTSLSPYPRSGSPPC